MARKKYFQVFFGNVVQIYQIEVSQTVSVDLATELLIDYSNDGEAWFDPETVNLDSCVLNSVAEHADLLLVILLKYTQENVKYIVFEEL